MICSLFAEQQIKCKISPFDRNMRKLRQKLRKKADNHTHHTDNLIRGQLPKRKPGDIVLAFFCHCESPRNAAVRPWTTGWDELG